MSAYLQGIWRRLRAKGFVGPHYRGLRGKVRMLREKWVVRHDVVSVATPTSLRSVEEPRSLDLSLKQIDRAGQLARYADEFADEYYPGYLDEWTEIFGWGQRLVLALVGDERVAGFYWVEEGSWEGGTTYHGTLLGADAQILRGGVVPSFRRRGVYTRLSFMLAQALFERGVERVFVECTHKNIASLRALVRAGFRPVGRLTVVGEGLLGRPFVRWDDADSVVEELEGTGLTVPKLERT